MFPLTCKRWKCTRCNPRKVREVEARLRAGLELGETWFLTLTMPGDVDRDASFRQVTPNFKLFRQRHERAFGRAAWATVVEEQPGRGVAHLHVLLRGSEARRRWLATAATASGFGKQVHVRPAAPSDVDYMIKSLHVEATVGLPTYVRRARFSRDWAAIPLQETSTANGDDWWIANAPPDETAEFLRAIGYSVSEVVPGWWSRRPPWLPVRWWPAGALASIGRPPLPFPARSSA